MLAAHSHRLMVALSRSLRQVRGQLVSQTSAVTHEALGDALRLALAEDENLLTGVIFERLRYVSPTLVYDIVVPPAACLRGCSPTLHPGAQLAMALWPPSLTDGTKRVEPDVVLHFGRLVLGIEVKWNDAQRGIQLESERAAIAAAHRDATIAMVALGGERDTIDAAAVNGTLLFLSWKDFGRRINELHANYMGEPAALVLEDIKWFLAQRDPLLVRPPSMPGELTCSAPVQYDDAWFPRLL